MIDLIQQIRRDISPDIAVDLVEICFRLLDATDPVALDVVLAQIDQLAQRAPEPYDAVEFFLRVVRQEANQRREAGLQALQWARSLDAQARVTAITPIHWSVQLHVADTTRTFTAPPNLSHQSISLEHAATGGQRRLTAAEQARVGQAVVDSRTITDLQTADELHVYIGYYNFDDGVDIPRWIIRHPVCDKGTALLTYWLMDPLYFYAEYASVRDMATYERPIFELCKEIEEKVLTDWYQSARIAFDPLEHVLTYHAKNLFTTLQQPFPLQLLTKTIGYSLNDEITYPAIDDEA